MLATLDDPELARLAALDYIHILEEKGATSELLSEYETYLERWPTDQASREKYAELLASAGQKDRACSQLELLLAEVEAAGDRVRVRQLREKILELRPDDLRAKFHLAQDCLAIGESEHASTLLLEVAQCALEQNDPHLAREAAQIALPLTPSREVVLNLPAASEALGETAEYEQVVAELAELGQPARAIEFYRKQVLTLLEQNKGKEAEAYVAKWLGLAPQDLDALEAAAKQLLRKNAQNGQSRRSTRTCKLVYKQVTVSVVSWDSSKRSNWSRKAQIFDISCASFSWISAAWMMLWPKCSNWWRPTWTAATTRMLPPSCRAFLSIGRNAPIHSSGLLP